MRLRKRVFASVLAFVLSFFLIPGVALAGEGENDAQDGHIAALAYECMVAHLDRLYPLSSIDSAKFTSESYSRYSQACAEASSFLESHGKPDEDSVTESQNDLYRNAYLSLRDAYYSLKPSAETITVSVSYFDTYAALHGSKEVLGASKEVSLASGSTLLDAVGSIHSGLARRVGAPGEHWLISINGILFTDLGQTLAGDLGMDGGFAPVLKDGDDVVLTYGEIPYDVSLIGVHGEMFLDEAAEHAKLTEFDAPSSFRLGETLSLSVSRKQIFPSMANGAVKPYAGAKVYRSGACSTEAKARVAAASIDTGLVLDSKGRATVSLDETGWYAINVAGASTVDGGTLSKNFIVHVTETLDLPGFKAKKVSELDDLLNKYPKTFYTDEQWQKVGQAHATALSNIDSARTSAAVSKAFNTAKDVIGGIQETNLSTASVTMNKINVCLSVLPSLSDLQKGKLYDTDRIALSWLFGDEGLRKDLTPYSMAQLGEDKAELLDALEKAYSESDGGKSLPAEPSFKVSIRFVDADTGADIDPALVNPRIYLDGEDAQSAKTGARYFTNPILSEYNIQARGGSWKSPLSMSDDYVVVLDPQGNDSRIVTDQIVSVYCDTKAQCGYALSSAKTSASSFYTSCNETHNRTNGTDYNYARICFGHSPRDNATITLYFKVPDEVSDARDAACVSLKSAIDALDKTDYEVEAWRDALSKYQEGLDRVKGCTSVEDVGKVKDDVLSAIAAVKKREVSFSSSIDGWGEGSPFNAGAQVGTVDIVVENTTYAGSPLFSKGADEDAFICQKDYALGENDSMMTVVLRALYDNGYTWNGRAEDFAITYLSSVESGKISLAEFDGGKGSGWMGTLNDWFVNTSFAEVDAKSGKVRNGDVIRVMYTCDLGADLHGSWDDPDTTLASLTVRGGSLVTPFSSGKPGLTSRLLVAVDGSNPVLKLDWAANNKNYLVKSFLNEKVDNNREGSSFYRTGGPIPVKSGDVVYVGCGAYAWPSMNNQAGNKLSYSGTWYELYVIDPSSGAPAVQRLIDEPSGNVTYANADSFRARVSFRQKALEMLTPEQRELVDVSKLDELEKRVETFEAVRDFRNELRDLPSRNLSSSQQVVAARLYQTYSGFSEEQRNVLEHAEIQKILAFEEYVKAKPGQPSGSESRDLSGASVLLSKMSYAYNGQKRTPAVVVKLGGVTLVKDRDYLVGYSSNVKVGKALVTVTGKGAYSGTATAAFSIVRASQSAAKVATAKVRAKGVKAKKLKKTRTFKLKASGILGGAKLTWKKISVPKAAKKRITLSKGGKLTVKKGLKRGTYKMKVKLAIGTTANYQGKTLTKTIKVVVK